MDARSSSSSDADGSFRSFLARSLDAIAREAPRLHGALARRLRGARVRLCVDDERVAVASDGSVVRVGDDRADATVELRTDSATLLDLTSGAIGFLDAALEDRMVVVGGVDEVVGFYDALVLYLQGAVRSASLAWLLDEFRTSRRGSAPQNEDGQWPGASM
ncbi:hypothetical protein K2Z84_27935 [Candidatus Binatia bacterium]|jgi:hypothetical protein|nr:hypothetical protein [Candidatus Binatia bacterium]